MTVEIVAYRLFAASVQLRVSSQVGALNFGQLHAGGVASVDRATALRGSGVVVADLRGCAKAGGCLVCAKGPEGRVDVREDAVAVFDGGEAGLLVFGVRSAG